MIPTPRSAATGLEMNPPLPVLVDEDVWPEFADALLALGERWTAPSGRSYLLALAGRRLEVSLALDTLVPPPPGDAVDADLFELACLVADRVGDPWSGDALRRLTALWGWEPG